MAGKFRCSLWLRKRQIRAGTQLIRRVYGNRVTGTKRILRRSGNLYFYWLAYVDNAFAVRVKFSSYDRLHLLRMGHSEPFQVDRIRRCSIRSEFEWGPWRLTRDPL